MRHPARYGLLLAAFPLPLILGFGFGDGLPLHVGGIIGPAAGERHDVIDHVALAPVGVSGLG